MFSGFFPPGSVKDRLVLGKEDQKGGDNGEGNGGCGAGRRLSGEVSSIKELLGSQFESLVLEIKHIHNRLDEIESRSSEGAEDQIRSLERRVEKLEALTESTVDEIVECYTAILENLDGPESEAVDKMVGKVGLAAGTGLVEKMEAAIHGSDCEDRIKDRVASLARELRGRQLE